jgi:DNA mismatch repair protein MutS
MDAGEKKVTPMMKQFLELKQQYSDCVLLFRAGDFYETFYDDAKECSKLLGITLTSRGGTPMAGVPYHSINPYIKKLVQSNKKVALCEQLEDPKQAKGLVKRGVTRVITPGTIIEEDYLQSGENNFICSVYLPSSKQHCFGIAFVDISTGECFVSQCESLEEVKSLLRKYYPQELVYNEDCSISSFKSFISSLGIYSSTLSPIRYNIHYANELIKRQFNKQALELGFESKDSSQLALGALLFYIYKLQKLDLSFIDSVKHLEQKTTMFIDATSMRNLELIESVFSKDSSKTLFGILNKTKTPAGSRLLKRQLVAPLRDLNEIEARLDAIEEMNSLVVERNEIRELLDSFADVERISSRIVSRIASPKDLYALKISLELLDTLKEHMFLFRTPFFTKVKELPSMSEVVEKLSSAVDETAPAHTRDLGYLKKEYHPELLSLSTLAFDSKVYIKELEEKYKLETGITTLKIKYNKVFGYFIEIPKSQMSLMNENFIQTQTLTNNQRYTTNELKDLEQKILASEEKLKILEQELYQELLDFLKRYYKQFQEISQIIAQLDVFCSHSLTSQLYSYTKPSFSESSTLIKEGRNPIVEQSVVDFISNDCEFTSSEKIKIVTGPNMAGKSTFLRQIALISIMAQCGMFVPATSATLKLYDRVFTRIGAHDELSQGHSTFMVEMVETATILQHATEHSLILLDEIGRGTSTYDGLAIAWAVVEEIQTIGADCIFATHYHQLNQLENMYSTIVNYHVLAEEKDNDIVFIRKIVKGGTDKSYGIHVAKLAGISSRVLNRAKEIQENIEGGEEIKTQSLSKRSLSKKPIQSKKLDEFIKKP